MFGFGGQRRGDDFVDEMLEVDEMVDLAEGNISGAVEDMILEEFL